MEHLTWIAFPPSTLTTDDETDEDNQLISDINNWRHCPDCFFLSNGTEACSFKPSRHVLCVSILAACVVACLKAVIRDVN